MLNYHQDQFSRAFNVATRDATPITALTPAQVQHLDVLEKLLFKMSSEEREFGIDVHNLDLVVTMRDEKNLGFVPFTVLEDGIQLNSRPRQLFNASSVDAEIDLIDVLAGEMAKAVARTEKIGAYVDYLGSPERLAL